MMQQVHAASGHAGGRGRGGKRAGAADAKAKATEAEAKTKSSAPPESGEAEGGRGGGDGGRGARRQKRFKDAEKAWVPAVGGGFMYLDSYETYPNWQFKCARCPAEEHCMKTRGIGNFSMRIKGSKLEPLAFLHAWHEMTPPWPTGKTHRSCTPKKEEVLVQLATNEAAFEALYNQCSTGLGSLPCSS